MIRVGVAGWSLPRPEQARFGDVGSHLVRYASRLGAVEVNSSFYRPHRLATWARWGASVPPGFRFAVKVPKAISHTLRLVDAEPLLDTFLAEVAGLGDRLGCLLLQLPPRLAFDDRTAARFFRALRERTDGEVACEPRHATWFAPEADGLLASFAIARVAADPPKGWTETTPGGWSDVRYYRLHGSPRTYWSSYDAGYLDALAARLSDEVTAGRRVWCIFDNTASGAATGNALDLVERLTRG